MNRNEAKALLKSMGFERKSPVRYEKRIAANHYGTVDFSDKDLIVVDLRSPNGMFATKTSHLDLVVPFFGVFGFGITQRIR